MVRIFVIDSNHLVRAGLARLLETAGFCIAGEAMSLDESNLLVSSASPVPPADLLLIDPTCHPDHQVATLIAIRAAHPAMKLVVLAEALPVSLLAELIATGIDGCLQKSTSPEALLQSLRLVLLGEQVVPIRLAMMLAQRCSLGEDGHAIAAARLDRIEAAILTDLALGRSNKEIARRLSLAESTIKGRLRSLQLKINAANRTQAAVWAVTNGFGQAA
jgi:two-component system, NarL family, nitrate/nitrite response regulator NarL